MPTPRTIRFTAYDFSEQELKSAAVFNPLQKMYLQTRGAEIAEQIINLDTVTQSQKEEFEVQRAYLKGQLQILEYILQASEAFEINIREEEAANYSNDFVVNQPPADGNIFGHSSQTNTPDGE